MREWILALATVCAVGCTSSSGDDPSGPDGDDDAPQMIPADVKGTVTDRARTGIAAATICMNGVNDPQCTTAAEDGTYLLHVEVPDGDTPVTAVFTADGYLGRVNEFAAHPGHGVVWMESHAGLYSTEEATNLLATQAGFTYPAEGKGFALVNVFGLDASDKVAATATLDGATVVYYDADRIAPDPTLTSGSLILFGNVEPGTHDITVTAEGRTCSITVDDYTYNDEWPATAGGTLGVAVAANSLTENLSVRCL